MGELKMKVDYAKLRDKILYNIEQSSYHKSVFEDQGNRLKDHIDRIINGKVTMDKEQQQRKKEYLEDIFNYYDRLCESKYKEILRVSEINPDRALEMLSIDSEKFTEKTDEYEYFERHFPILFNDGTGEISNKFYSTLIDDCATSQKLFEKYYQLFNKIINKKNEDIKSMLN